MSGNKNIFLFPGQGAQYVGMLNEFQENFKYVAELIEEADDILGVLLSEIIKIGPENELQRTENAQPAIMLTSRCIEQVLFREFGIQANYLVAGHSLGEYSALLCNGALSFPDALRLVRKRGQYMQECVPEGKGSMSAILGLEDAVVDAVCEEVSTEASLVEAANYNCPGQVVISGHGHAVAAAEEKLKGAGAKRCIPLKVSAPFHCRLLKPAGERLAADLQNVNFKAFEVPYVANVNAELIGDETLCAQLLQDQVWKPVRWRQTLERMLESVDEGIKIYEVGPSKVLSGHLKKCSSEHEVLFTNTWAQTKTLSNRIRR